MEELISVIIPTYNRAHCIRNAVESVIAQNYEQLEIIVVDDASRDNTEEIVASIKDSRIKYIYNQKNSGAAAARNIGIQVAQGNFIAFQDSDDIWLEGKLKKQLEVMKQGKYGMVYGCIERSYLDGHKEKIPRDTIQKEAKQGIIYPYLLAESYISTQTILVKREILEQVQGFDEAMKSYEDYDLALRIAKCCKVGFIDQVLVQVNTLEDSIDMNMTRGIISSAYLLKKYETDLKQYGLYDRKRSVVYEAAQAYGIWGPIESFLGK